MDGRMVDLGSDLPLSMSPDAVAHYQQLEGMVRCYASGTTTQSCAPQTSARRT